MAPSLCRINLFMIGLPFIIFSHLSLTFGNDTGGDAQRTPQTGLASLKTHEGLEAAIFAAEPMVHSLTNLDIDHRGRIWACEVMNYRGHAYDDQRPEGDRIVILEDTDGDGRADDSKVYYQGRDVDAAMGICVLGNRVIVTCAPNVIMFTDEDGDDKPDRKEMLFTKTGAWQNDHSTHSFLFGPDGRLYWNFGNAGLYVHDKNGEIALDQDGNPIVTKEGARELERFDPDDTSYYGGMVFRCELDGSNVEALAHNFRNNYEVAVDSFGNMWQSDNDDDGHYGCRINYIMEYGNYGYRDEMTGAGWQEPRTGWHDDIPHRHWHQNDPGVVPNLVHTGAGSPTGITVYEGRLLPEVFWDQVIHCDAGPGVVWSFPVKKDGAGFAAKTVNILKTTKDKWFRPVDVAVAPDGSLFVTDWYDPVVGWNRQYDLERGRIYRIAPEDHAYQNPAFDFSTAKGAAEALKNPNYAVRYMAWTALHDMQKKAEPALLEIYQSENPQHRARALWLLGRIAGRGKHYVKRAIEDSDADIRLVGVRLARQLNLNVCDVVEQLIDDPSAQVRRECAIALRHHPDPRAPKLWAELAARHDGNDRWYVEALGIGAHKQWDAFLAAWLDKAGNEWDTPAGRDIIWRSRAERTPTRLAQILSDSRMTAPDSKRYLRAFDFQQDSERKRTALKNLVLSQPPSMNAAQAYIASEALMRIKTRTVNNNPDLKAALNNVVKASKHTPQFARLVDKFALTEFYPDLVEIAAYNPDTPEAVTALTTILETGETDSIRDALNSDYLDYSTTIVRILGRCYSDRAQRILKDLIMNEQKALPLREQAVRSLAGNQDGAHLILELAETGELPEDFKPIAGKAIAGTMNVGLRERAAELLPIPALKNNQEVPQMTELLVYHGDAERGKEVFAAATCLTCHKVSGEGIEFGPDLSEIGSKLSKRGLYESILMPSDGISYGYENYQVTFNDGRVVNGILISETANRVTMKLNGGVTFNYDKSEIASIEMQSKSLMTEDLLQLMTIDELVDLVEYLTTLKRDSDK